MNRSHTYKRTSCVYSMVIRILRSAFGVFTLFDIYFVGVWSYAFQCGVYLIWRETYSPIHSATLSCELLFHWFQYFRLPNLETSISFSWCLVELIRGNDDIECLVLTGNAKTVLQFYFHIFRLLLDKWLIQRSTHDHSYRKTPSTAKQYILRRTFSVCNSIATPNRFWTLPIHCAFNKNGQ